MRPASNRVANRKKQAATSRSPLNLRRACWRSFPEPQEEFDPQGHSRRMNPIPKEGKSRCRRRVRAAPGRKASFLSSARAVSLGRPSSFRPCLTTSVQGGHHTNPHRPDAERQAEEERLDPPARRGGNLVEGWSPYDNRPRVGPTRLCSSASASPLRKTKTCRFQRVSQAAGLGLEPRLPDPELYLSAVTDGVGSCARVVD
jgi:hypothetical protein